MDQQSHDALAPTRSAFLPGQPGVLIGRGDDVARVLERLKQVDVRLLTLVGPAGTGKTRLALAAAAQATETFSDGAWFVDLSPVRDPDLVPSAIATALGIHEKRDRALIETLKDDLSTSDALLVLDNFEQVLAAGPHLADLLGACPRLKLLVTSRSALHLRWEHELAVSPLAVPDLARLPPPDELARIASVALFVDRTQRVDPEFRLDETNARTIAEICLRLDGLPLAIELAAARTRVLPPRALLSRLGRRLVALDNGPQDQPARQRSLRDALDWSYDLLSPTDQALFRRLGVFVGGFALDAVLEVCDPRGSLGLDLLHAVESLAEKSLLRRVERIGEEEPRFGMLETIRDYALERLDASEERDLLRYRHAEYYLAGGEIVITKISSAHQAAWLRNLELEHDNIRAALTWCVDAHAPDLGLRAVGLLAWFWHVRGHVGEGRARVSELLEVGRTTAPSLVAEGLRIAGSLALSQSDDRAARELFEESLAIRRQGDLAGVLGPLTGLGFAAMRQGDDSTASACFREALWIQRRIQDQIGMAESLNSLANIAHGRGDLVTARELYEQSQMLNRETGYRADVVEHNLGVVSEEQGNLAAARRYFESSVAARRVLDDTPGLALSLAKLGEVLAAQGAAADAQRVLAEAVVLQRELGDLPGLAFVLERIAMVATHSQPERALHLAGACAALREHLGTPLSTAARSSLDERLAPAWQTLRRQDAERAWQEGRALSVEQAVSLALQPVIQGHTEPAPAATINPSVGLLTPREREVAALVARGLTNRQIAVALVVSERTADAHVSNILNKLDVTSRVQLAAWVVRHGLSKEHDDDMVRPD
ncbi:MAG TPA: LuxR C-terminal-related transcriptional regulator [Chloroflexota bacterium]|jgi:predicted ATPase/DNA-binding CsgD family transcriptional regulator|nr:LuxR C-terminal-related transcriptional regulator [Chloroflexota bacterium]